MVRRSEPTTSAPSMDAMRMERSIALIRIAVVAVVAVVYFSSTRFLRPTSPIALSVLALAAVYSLWSLIGRPRDPRTLRRFQIGTLLVDTALVTLWVLATDGPESEFWVLYLIVIMSVAMRFDLSESLAAAVGSSVLYLTVMWTQGGLSLWALVARPSLMLIGGFACGLMARQGRIHQREQEQLARIAEVRSQRLEEETAAVERLRRSDEAKSEFVAVASHEFRTPLAAVIGVLSTLRSHGDEIDPDVRAELLDAARTQASRLARLVEDLLTVSRLEDGALPLVTDVVRVDRLVTEAAQASGTSDVLDVRNVDVKELTCDPDHLVRVLTNLLDNARKYSSEGGRIQLEVARMDDAVVFRVSDEGPGIPPDEREAVFDRFHRARGGGDAPGSGLGLYIARGLVEAHGGTIEVGDAFGGGAQFIVSLPAAGPPADARRPASRSSPHRAEPADPADPAAPVNGITASHPLGR